MEDPKRKEEKVKTKTKSKNKKRGIEPTPGCSGKEFVKSPSDTTVYAPAFNKANSSPGVKMAVQNLTRKPDGFMQS